MIGAQSAFSTRILALKLIGITKHSDLTSKIRFGCFMLFGIMQMVSLLQGFSLDGSITEKCLLLIGTASEFGLLIKAFVLYTKTHVLYELFHELQNVPSNYSVGYRTKWLTNAYWYSVIGCLALFGLVPIIVGNFQPPIPMMLPFDTTTYLGRIGKFFHFIIYMSVVGNYLFIIDSIFLIVGSQICTLIYELNEILESQPEYLANPERWLVNAIKKHNKIIRLMKLFGELIRTIYFLQTITSMLLSCALVLAINKMELPVFELPRVIPLMGAVYFEFFIYCWVGENITNQWDNLHFAMYCNNWFNESTKFRKFMLVSQSNTVQPKVLKGGGIVNMRLHTFMMSVRESFSWFMVMRTVTQKYSD